MHKLVVKEKGLDFIVDTVSESMAKLASVVDISCGRDESTWNLVVTVSVHGTI